jgi:hypothetical protein
MNYLTVKHHHYLWLSSVLWIRITRSDFLAQVGSGSETGSYLFEIKICIILKFFTLKWSNSSLTSCIFPEIF